MLIRILGFIFFIFFANLIWAEEFIQVPLAIHISSNVSDGKYSIEDIVKIVKDNNFKAVVITDRDLMEWEYGLWPLRNIIKKRVSFNSILKFGPGRYLKLIEEVQKNNPDVIVISGLESAPYCYWKGSIFKDKLYLCDWHKHILVVRLDKPEDYKHLPVVGNKEGLRIPFCFKNIFYFWPILFILIGFILLVKNLLPYSKLYRILARALIIIGVIFLVENFPFLDLKFSPYQGNLGALPYQYFIDYVDKKGAITIWVHPETENIQQINNVVVETRDYSHLLIETRNYTGFAIFYEGYQKIGKVGGIWDELLNDYCQGKRNKPVWAIGTLGFDSVGNLEDYLKDLRNVILVKEFNKEELLQVIKKGRFYVLRGKLSSDFILDKFVIKDNFVSREANAGEEIILDSFPLVEIKGYFIKAKDHPFNLKLIRGGKVIKVWSLRGDFHIIFEDNDKSLISPTFYRIEIEADNLHLISNPIFLKFKR